MTDLQIGALLTVLGRIGDALEQHNVLLMAAQGDRPAPKLLRSLEAYANFDWTTIGAAVIAHDRHGATEVEWGGRMFVRRRSAEDDNKGEDIRFTRVVSGTVAEKNLVWETLIKFGGNRKPAKPLRGDLAEKVENSAASLPPAAPATTPVAVVPPPAKVIPPPATTAAAPEKPTGPAVVPARDPAVDDAHAAAVKAYRARFNTDLIPGHLSLGYGDSENQVRQATDALTRMATTGDQWGAHDVPADRTIPTPPPSANESIEVTPDEQARTEIAALIRKAGTRPATEAQCADVVAALAAHHWTLEQFTQAVWEKPRNQIPGTWIVALHMWLRPARNTAGVFVANPTAREMLKAMAVEVPA
jgi:hypothetical protein